MSSTKPLLAVVGTTGVGKSQLGVELAKALGGEIVNADSMQGLDVATNKAPIHERQGVPHHLMDFVEPSKEYSVAEFERDASRVIADIHSRGRVPILVGGTNYYIQSLLWKQQIIANTDDVDEMGLSNESMDDVPHATLKSHPLAERMAEALQNTDQRCNTPDEVEKYHASTDLLGLLAQVDPGGTPEIVARSDGVYRYFTSFPTIPYQLDLSRIVRRQIFYRTGRKHSDIMAEQKQNPLSSASPLRFNTCVFWLYADPKALYPRLDARVDEMIKLGLFKELGEMRAQMRDGLVVGSTPHPQASEADATTESAVDGGSLAPQVNYTRGILQAIGFKEFHKYLTRLELSPTLSDDDPDLAALRDQGLDEMKRGTRQYARRQVAWIKNKLAVSCLGDMDSTTHQVSEETKRMGFFLLDATSLDDWSSTVAAKAVALAENFISNHKTPDPRTLSEVASQMLPSVQKDDSMQPPAQWTKYTCPICVDLHTRQPRVLNGMQEWKIHLATTGHRKRTKRAETDVDGSAASRKRDREPV
ncbi:tRNA dimethylallyltransferase [Powellomyces hirtus]|uniref:tRNA dimethylallyltransferase n=1 Tax=Powellomyces hirtus TaxID=109895 RepID=A0A507E3H1_9FUNG|nr:tRNA dimethylallyltransferase [Powellomyces hirtus]